MEVKRLTAQSLISKLGSVSDTTRTSALCELRLLTKTDPDIRPIIASSGAIPFLADSLYSDDPVSQENAAATLLNLSISCKHSLMSTRSVLDALSHALSFHTRHHPAAVQAAAATVYSLAVDEAFRPVVGSKRDIVYALIDIVRNPNSPNCSIKDCVKALFGISLYPPNRGAMIEFGVIEALFGLVVKAGRVGMVADATAVIAQVSGDSASPEAVRRVSGVRVLVDLLDPSTGSSLRIKENAVSGLLNLVECGGEAVAEEVREVGFGLVFNGLGEVAEIGSSKGVTRAKTLIKILQNGMLMMRGDELGLQSTDSSLNSYSGSNLNSAVLLNPRAS